MTMAQDSECRALKGALWRWLTVAQDGCVSAISKFCWRGYPSV
jgi:hypothetical protein